MTFSKLGSDTETNQPVYLPKSARTKGLYIIGLQGMGKSGLLENLIMQDIKQQIGVCVLDPKRELIDNVIARLEPKHEKDVVLLDIRDYQFPFGLNLVACSDTSSPLDVQEVTDHVRHIFEKLLGVSEETQMIIEYLYNCSHTLAVNPGYTLADMPLLLRNKNCRQKLVANVTDIEVVGFWEQYELKQQGRQSEEIASTIRRVNQLLQPILRPLVGQAKTTIDFRAIMDDRKILLVKLDRTMKQSTTIVGSIIVALILKASASRQTQRPQFHLYADEFQRFATEDFATLLEEARYADIGITMAHQNRSQLELSEKQADKNLKARTLNVDSLIVFRVPTDADELAGQFDTTPPPAWEEELEEERLEIREQERLEMMEVIDGEEEIDSPASNPLQSLLRGHTNNTINDLVRTYVKPLIKNYPVYGKDGSEIDTYLDISMRGEFLPTTPESQNLLFQLATNYAGIAGYSISLLSFGSYPFLREEYPSNEDIFAAVRDLVASVSWDSIYEQPSLSEDVLANLQEVLYQQYMKELFCKTTPSGEGNWEMTAGERAWKEAVKEKQAKNKAEENEAIDAYIANHRKTTSSQYNVAFEYSDKYGNSCTLDTVFSDALEYTANLREQHKQDIQEETLSMYRESLVATDLVLQRRKQYAEQRASEAVEKIQEFLLGMVQLGYELSKEENVVYTGSGIRQPRKRQHILLHPEKTFPHPRVAITHPQQSRAEKEKEIAGQLLHLQKFTAWVKIGEAFPQNPGKKCLKCELLNNYDDEYCYDCGTQLPAPNEYIIETAPPEKGLYGKSLQERVNRIQAQNRKPDQFGYVYCRSLQEVEAEITQRQTSCSSGSASAQLQQPQQPSQQARHARTVPVQGNCPTCGKSNPSDSIFCNKCGAKLK